MAANKTVDVSQSPRLQQQDFSESATDVTLGPPVKRPTVNGEAIEQATSSVQAVNQWVAMTQADQGLLDAIYNFINTTKEGTSVSPDTVQGRNKKMFFNFYGNIGKSIMPGEIGQFEVNFRYEPKTKLGTGVPLQPSAVTPRGIGTIAEQNPTVAVNAGNPVTVNQQA
jgi:hypothetical protein